MQSRAHVHICGIGAGIPGGSGDVIPQDPVEQGPDFEIGEVGARAAEAVDVCIERQASVTRWPVGNHTQEEMRADD